MDPVCYDVIIPIYNGFEYLHALFNSLKNGTTLPHRLIIINDCSTDNKISEVLENIEHYRNSFCQELIIHHNLENKGFVKSVNFAYTLTKNNFVILNTDTEVPLGWLERLMYPIEHSTDVASVTPLTNSGTICSFPNWLEDNELAFGLSLEEIDNTLQDINDQNLIEVPTGVGFCMAINRSIIEKIGFFDADTFGHGYGEENDWCMRAKSRGYKNVIICNLYVYHKHGGSFGSNKAALLASNAMKLSQKHPTYNKEVANLCYARPMEDLFAKASLIMFLRHNPAIIFCHFLGGGSEHFIHEHLLFDTKSTYHILIRGSGERVKDNLEFYSNFKCIFKTTIKDLIIILDLLSNSKTDEYYLNHVININNLPEDYNLLTDFFLQNQIRAIYYLHDYFFVCPTVNLINNQKKYCGIPADLEVCNSCLADHKDFIHFPLPTNLSIQKWRTAMVGLLNQCVIIYSFSDSSSLLLTKVYPNLTYKIQKYTLKLKKIDQVIDVPNFKNNKTINIGILGIIQVTKGLKIIQQLSNIMAELCLPYKITTVGFSTEPIFNANVLGPYNKEYLPKICQDANIDLFIVPSIWPETYCYTAHEIMSMGYPVICFDLGAPAERIKKYEHGLVVPKCSALDLLNSLMQFVKKYEFDFEEVYLADNAQAIEQFRCKSLITALNSVNEELNHVYNSKSWTLTKPIRLAANIARRIKRKLTK